MLYVVSDVEHTIMFKFLEEPGQSRGTKCDEIRISRYSQIDDLRNLIEVVSEFGANEGR